MAVEVRSSAFGKQVAQAVTNNTTRLTLLALKGVLTLVFIGVSGVILRGILRGDIPANRLVLLVAAAALITGLVIDVIQLLPDRTVKVGIFRHGIVVITDGEHQEARWKELRQVRYRTPLLFGEGTFRIELETKDADILVLRPPLPMSAITKAIESQVQRHMVEEPRAPLGQRTWVVRGK